MPRACNSASAANSLPGTEEALVRPDVEVECLAAVATFLAPGLDFLDIADRDAEGVAVGVGWGDGVSGMGTRDLGVVSIAAASAMETFNLM